MIRPVASFGCQIWGANFLELNKGLHCCLESVHTRYLRMVLGVGSKVDQDGCELRRAAQPTTRIGLLVSSTSGMS